MQAFFEFLSTVFITGVIALIVFVFCCISFPSFRYFAGRVLKQFAWSIIICITSMLLALIYIVSPIDIIPDPIPILGQIDDIGVFTAAFLVFPARMIYLIKTAINAAGDAPRKKDKN